jgi:nucleoside-diphosphate-sugar epimerase
VIVAAFGSLAAASVKRDSPGVQTLLSFGHGYSAAALTRLLRPAGWRVIGTTRSADRMAALTATGVEAVLWDGAGGRDAVAAALADATHVLTSVPPDAAGDPVLARMGDLVAAAVPRLVWAGYLSTTGVYGDHGGGWVDETTPLTPTTERGRARVAAEAGWQALAAASGLALHIFRLAGIYGPGRGPFEKVRDGTARRIIKPGQVFSRIHIDDIARVLAASIARPDPGAIYNLCDDDPAPPEDVLAEAARLLGLPPPPEVPFAQADLGPMARSFYAESKRVRNDRIKRDLGIRLIHPDYRSGLRAILAAEAR